MKINGLQVDNTVIDVFLIIMANIKQVSKTVTVMTNRQGRERQLRFTGVKGIEK